MVFSYELLDWEWITIIYILQANVFALIILAIIYLNFRKRAETKNLNDRIFIYLVESNALLLILDIMMTFLDGRIGSLANDGLIAVTLLFYIFNPIPCLLWTFYADYFIFKDLVRLKKYFGLAVIPAVVNAGFAIISIWGNYSFFIDANNAYHRGQYFYVMVVANLSYILFTLIHIYKNKSKIRRDDRAPLMLFAVPPLIAGILQTMYYGIAIVWPSVTISILIVFIYVQATIINTDYLTGLFNRREFDKYIIELFNRKAKGKLMVGMMMDLDHFKSINDTYGHNIGDIALIQLSDILRSSFRKNDFVARYGGDEFAVIFEVDDKSQVENIFKRFENNITEFNLKKLYPFQLSLSIGSGIYDLDSDLSMVDFFKVLDQKMYEEKYKKNMLDYYE